MRTRSDALIAVTRFGLGPSPRDLERARSDPRGWAAAQVAATPTTPAPLRDLPPLAVLLETNMRHRAERREAARALRKARREGDVPAALQAAFDAERKDLRKYVIDVFRREMDARIVAGLVTDTPLVERLVAFWSNHFAIEARNLGTRLFVGNHEREAIRPFVLGRFEDMAKAALLHPAMLGYLDNIQSVGPNSRVGRRTGRSINENLAREILELHTLGVDGGYTQDDVRALAMMLTGWHGGADARPGRVEQVFAKARHEPGPKTLLGRTYRGRGPRQAFAAITDLAAHPATARHVTGKLARHFVSDDPPPALLDRLERVFRDTGGDLGEVTRTLIAADEAWAAPPNRLVSPYDFVIASMRTFGVRAADRTLLREFRTLGYNLWRPDAPTGFPDGGDAWLGGDHLLERLDWASAFARREGKVAAAPEPVPFATQLLGPDLDADLHTTLARAESRTQALALLLMSVQWQRR